MYKIKSEIAIRHVGRFSWKLMFYIFLKKKFYIFYLAGYPVSGKIIWRIPGGRIFGQISIRYNPRFKKRKIQCCGSGSDGSTLFWLPGSVENCEHWERMSKQNQRKTKFFFRKFHQINRKYICDISAHQDFQKPEFFMPGLLLRELW